MKYLLIAFMLASCDYRPAVAAPAEFKHTNVIPADTFFEQYQAYRGSPTRAYFLIDSAGMIYRIGGERGGPQRASVFKKYIGKQMCGYTRMSASQEVPDLISLQPGECKENNEKGQSRQNK